MIQKYFWMSLLSLSFFLPASAEVLLCQKAYIRGLEGPHERALQVLGKGLTSNPEKMSVFLTVALWKGRKALYLQTNYAPKGNPYPSKFGATDEENIKYLLYVIRNYKKPFPFDLSGVVYYVEPAFFADPLWGKHQKELVGKVNVLSLDDRVQKTYFQANGHP